MTRSTSWVSTSSVAGSAPCSSGFFATAQADGGAYVKHEGLFYGGGVTQLMAQAEGAALVTVWSFVVALVIGFLVKITVGLRVSPEAEIEGIDVAEHKESAYDLSPSAGGGSGAFALAGIGAPAAASAVTSAAASADTEPAKV